MTTTETTQLNLILQEFKQKLKELYGKRLVKLILYGSQSTGKATKNSDIDLMVVLKGHISPGDEIFKMGDIKNKLNLKYDQLISVFPISEDDFFFKETPLLKNVRQEGLIL